jgi:hypothetical protein
LIAGHEAIRRRCGIVDASGGGAAAVGQKLFLRPVHFEFSRTQVVRTKVPNMRSLRHLVVLTVIAVSQFGCRDTSTYEARSDSGTPSSAAENTTDNRPDHKQPAADSAAADKDDQTRASAREPAVEITDAELDEFQARANANEPFAFEKIIVDDGRRRVEALLRAAQTRRPEAGPWAMVWLSIFALDKNTNLKGEAREKHFRRALAYLQTSGHGFRRF